MTAQLEPPGVEPVRYDWSTEDLAASQAFWRAEIDRQCALLEDALDRLETSLEDGPDALPLCHF